MYICPNCGKQYEGSASFCIVCGSPVVPMQPPVASAPPAASSPAAPYTAPAAPYTVPAAPYAAPAAPYTAPAAPYTAPAAPYTAPAAPYTAPAAPYAAPAAPSTAPAAPYTAPAASRTAPASAEKSAFLPTLFGFIGNVCSIVAGFFIILTLVTLRVSSYGYVWFDEVISSFALLFALGSIGFAVVNFIFALLKRVDLGTNLSKITHLVLGTLLLILAIMLFM